MVKHITRREFLLQTASTMAALELSKYITGVDIVQANSLPSVSVATGVKEDTPELILRSALAGLGGIERFVKPGQVVAIKPNATWAYPPHTASSTDPDLLTAMINIVAEAGASRIIVMDHCSIEPGTSECLRVNGIGKVVKDLQVDGIFPDRFNGPKSLFEPVELPNGKAFQKLNVIKAALEADVRINMSLAKTHSVTRMTMALKHMMGFLENPGALHAHLAQGIADLNSISKIQADLHILEALLVRVPYGDYRVCAGPETEERNPQIIKRHNQIIVGVDPVLMDAYGCINYYEIKPKELAHVKISADSGAGEMDVEKAIADGKLISINAGEEFLQATPTQPMKTEVVSISSTPTVQKEGATSTPIPPATPVAVAQVIDSPNGSVNASSSCDQVVKPNKFLDLALLPVAAIVLGISMVILRRTRLKEEKQNSTGAIRNG